jgi:uncharacterized protein YcaQ
MHELSRQDARRIAIRAQLLAAARPGDLLALARQLTLLQADATAAVAPSAELVMWSRLGPDHPAAELADAVDQLRLIDLRGMLRPAEDLALYRAEMQQWPGTGEVTGWRRAHQGWLRANEACRRDILDRLRCDGPLTARELPDTCAVPWRSSGWNKNRNVAMMLDLLVLSGQVAAAGRRGRDRLWDLAERIYPDDPVVPLEDALRIRDERRLRALGIARSRGPECPVEPLDVGAAGEPAVIAGVRGEWRVDPAQLGQPFRGRTALLSPLDRLVYDRQRMVEIFEFDYQLEMYKPAAKRRWGYYALPVLHGDRLVGKVDAAADRSAQVLRVNAIHRDVEFTKAMDAAVHREIAELAGWLGLELAA